MRWTDHRMQGEYGQTLRNLPRPRRPQRLAGAMLSPQDRIGAGTRTSGDARLTFLIRMMVAAGAVDILKILPPFVPPSGLERPVPRLRLLLIAVASLLLVACSNDKAPATPAALQTATPPPQASAEEVANRYFQLWSSGKYAEMYDLLSAGSRQAIMKDRFTARHEGIADEARMTAIKVALTGHVQDGSDRAGAPYRVTYTTAIWGDVRQENTLPLVKEADGWRVEWTPSLIFRELKGANLVRAVVDAPKRGAILDRNGTALAVTGAVP